MTKIIGLTGGIGSGKTTIAKYIETKGIPVYIADERAKIITNSPEILSLIKEKFGQDVFDNDVLNRKKLANIVFNHPKQLKQLNQIIHPAVKLDFDIWLQNHSKFEYVVKESAILFKSNNFIKFYITIAVVTPLPLRIERILLRDNTDKAEIMKRIDNQLSDNELIEKCDYVIYNSELDISLMQVDAILKKLKIK
ncbi:MAG: dephospho-CoA kinase [Flavobacterium sp.]|nr:dephospho-CoA kinase [Flavobacterium sp.]